VVLFIVLIVLLFLLIVNVIIFIRKYVRNVQRMRAVREHEHMTENPLSPSGGTAAGGFFSTGGGGGSGGGSGDKAVRMGSGGSDDPEELDVEREADLDEREARMDSENRFTGPRQETLAALGTDISASTAVHWSTASLVVSLWLTSSPFLVVRVGVCAGVQDWAVLFRAVTRSITITIGRPRARAPSATAVLSASH
jgi:hypothetical protein